jgi:hypothetical protein
MRRMRRFSVPVGPLTFLGLLGFLLAQAAAADLDRPQAPLGGFRATCEDLGTFCFADACGGDQIDAARNCRARCPSAAILSVVPSTCRRPGPIILRSRG